MYATRPLQVSRSPVAIQKNLKKQFDPKTGYPIDQITTTNYNVKYGVQTGEWDDVSIEFPFVLISFLFILRIVC